MNLWRGGDNYEVPISMGRYVTSQIPTCQATFYKSEGHLLLFLHRQDI